MKLLNKIEKCFPTIESFFSESELLRFRQCSYAELSDYHLGVGVRIRNDILHEQSTLFSAFVSVGVFHKDDMSSIILLHFFLCQKEKGI